ncbi:phosphatase PAP2 family protein [Neobacillus sp. MER 74]|uniref:phosphatase PAP2 family protein n=1 Tax=unclassified Neobacillus TaxID=2675272 RepID=UPI00203DE765|nr:phosphatase PAP2 family protein [Neobacillus sp. MER 74]MCM3114356.1 phosphatase PAP2 family protein [Neobacillus sp. MER 74]
MERKNKRSVSYLFIIFAFLWAVFTCMKVAMNSNFWIDIKVAGLAAHVPELAIPFFIKITAMGDKIGIGIVAILALAWLLIKKRNYVGAAALALSTAIGNEVSKLFKDFFERPRPDLEHLVSVKSYSYPSGHAMVGMIVYFMIAYLLMEEARSKAGKVIIAVITAILLLLIGASRIILQVHYPSDVLGGYALGYLWVVIWILLYNYFKKRIK